MVRYQDPRTCARYRQPFPPIPYCLCPSRVVLCTLRARHTRYLDMSYLESLAVRFVEPDGLSVDEQDKIIADAADCEFLLEQTRRHRAPKLTSNFKTSVPAIESILGAPSHPLSSWPHQYNAGTHSLPTMMMTTTRVCLLQRPALRRRQEASPTRPVQTRIRPDFKCSPQVHGQDSDCPAKGGSKTQRRQVVCAWASKKDGANPQMQSSCSQRSSVPCSSFTIQACRPPQRLS